MSSVLRQALAWHGKPRGERRWVYVPYDQLSGPLAREAHHIARLMVLANLAPLLDVERRELSDWFWVAFTDAYDWWSSRTCSAWAASQ